MVLFFLRRLWAVLLIFPGVACAWQQCLDVAPAQRFACLEPLELEHIGDLEFELQLAESARVVGKYDYASVVLERLVLIHPEQAGARLDLVILAMRAGNLELAEEQLDQLLALPKPPAVARSLMQQLQQRLNARAATATISKPDYRVMLGLGYDDNPNLGIGSDAIDVLVDNVTQSLRLESGFTPEPSPYLEMGLALDYPYEISSRVRAVVDARKYDGQSQQDTLSTTIQAEHRIGGNRYLQGMLSDFRMRDGLYLSRAGVGVRQVVGKCNCYSIGSSLDVMEGSERAFSSLRGRFSGEVKKVYAGVIWHGYGGVAIHRQPYAPWGDTYSAQLGGDAIAPLFWGRLVLGVSRYNSYDEERYSPLFGESRRDITRNQFRVGYSQLGWYGVELYTDISYVDQESPIPLYTYDRSIVEVGLKRSLW